MSLCNDVSHSLDASLESALHVTKNVNAHCRNLVKTVFILMFSSQFCTCHPAQLSFARFCTTNFKRVCETGHRSLILRQCSRVTKFAMWPHTGSAPLTGRYCNCHESSSYVEDEGYLEDTHWFPIKTLVFGDTYYAHKEMYYTLGPLKCAMGTDATNRYCLRGEAIRLSNTALCRSHLQKPQIVTWQVFNA